jgi:uncharacterized membrane protein
MRVRGKTIKAGSCKTRRAACFQGIESTLEQGNSALAHAIVAGRAELLQAVRHAGRTIAQTERTVRDGAHTSQQAMEICTSACRGASVAAENMAGTTQAVAGLATQFLLTGLHRFSETFGNVSGDANSPITSGR